MDTRVVNLFPVSSQRCRQLVLFVAGLLFATGAAAEWRVIDAADDSELRTPYAQIENADGYTLTIYRDGDDNVHALLRLNDRLTGFDTAICPTYQIDDRQPRNMAADGSACSMRAQVGNYHLGRIESNQIVSRPLHEFMNGTHIDFRFRLANADYDQTRFSLAGSKRALSAVLGDTLEVLPR